MQGPIAEPRNIQEEQTLTVDTSDLHFIKGTPSKEIYDYCEEHINKIIEDSWEIPDYCHLENYITIKED